MPALYEQIADQAAELRRLYQAQAAAGLQWPEIFRLAVSGLQAIVRLCETVHAAGPDKKALALDLWDEFYREVIAPIDLKGVPNWLEETIIDPAIHQISRQFIGGAIDRIVEQYNRGGWE